MAIKNQANLDTANTVAMEKFQEHFNGPAPGAWPIFTEEYSSSAQTDELVFVTWLNAITELLGSRQYGNFEAYKQSISLRTYADTIALPRKMVDYDTSGSVGRAIRQKIENARADSVDKLIFDELTSASGDGPTAFDADPLFSTTHTLGGTDYSNKTTSALGFDTYNTGVQTMQEYKKANADPMNVFPTHLIVGPKMRRMALEITGAEVQPFTFNTSGAIERQGTNMTSNIATSGLTNVHRGEVTVVVWQRLTGTQDDYWYLVDASKTDKPFLLKMNRDFELIDRTQMRDDARWNLDMYEWSIEGDMTPAAGAWPLMYAGIL